jgi:predicted DNA-binding protein (MmcQ/YjbR family)
MNIEQLRDYCLSKPDVEETLPFGPDTLVFKINAKVFLLAALDEDPLRFNVKCNPDEAVMLREEYPTHVLPGYHMNKKHWNTIVADGNLSAKLIKKFIDASYDLVKPNPKKATRGA